ncbi:uncharacterized protein JCM15063_004798 [Sporobolomyces koalae]|uniref:uncharacterized protein n=1 Tax=Sporobolomyces koalae TaxID=500713 RepID=UPI003171F0A5
MSFSTQLAQLLDRLGQRSSTSPAHLQHLVIRVQRAKTQAEHAQGSTGLESLVRLRGRLEELEEGLRELDAFDDRHEWATLASKASRARQALQDELRTATTAIAQAVASVRASDSPNGRQSRSSSAELSRRTPRLRPAVTEGTATTPTVDAFLSRLESGPVRPPSTLPTLAHERAKALTEAYSLFLLCTEPSSVLPAGQTLSSIFQTAASSPAKSRTESRASFEARISSQAHRARYDDLEKRLSGQAPSRRVFAWDALRQDLAEACLPLIPGRLNIKKDVSKLLLHLIIDHGEWQLEDGFKTIKQLVVMLRRLCAPARDQQAQAIVDSTRTGARGLVEVVQDVVKLARDMQNDLDQFRMKATASIASEQDEQDIAIAVRDECQERERETVRKIVARETSKTGQEVIDQEIRVATRQWIRNKTRRDDSLEEKIKITKPQVLMALVEALFDDQAIGPPPVPGALVTRTNAVPPILYAVAPRLFELQNALQALTILACLATTLSALPTNSVATCLSRLSSILESEMPTFSNSKDTRDDVIPTRIEHLSSEIINHFENSNSSDPNRLTYKMSESRRKTIKEAVDRYLRYQDPVFKLMQNRLKEAIKTEFLRALEPPWSSTQRAETGVPSEIKTGRNRVQHQGENTRSSFSPQNRKRLSGLVPELPLIKLPLIKGYELLRDKVDETGGTRLATVWDWFKGVWHTVLLKQ